MANITYDSELMKLHVSAIPVPPSRRFYTVRDENDRPLIFSIGLDHVLYALKENSSGGRTLVDLGKALGIDQGTEKVTSLDVAQDWKSDHVYLTFTTAPVDEDADKQTAGLYRLNVLCPFDPSRIDPESDNNDLRDLVVPPANNKNDKITEVFMADSKAAGASYPEIMVAHVPRSSISKSTDLARISFEDNFKTWKMASDFDLPENASDVVGICPAVSSFGPGYFTLYRIQGQNRLVFITLNKVSGFAFEVALACPEDARTLRTYREPGRRGYSALLVGGEGLYHWASNEYLRAGQRGRLVSGSHEFKGVAQLDVAQSDTSLSIFALSQAFGISYTRVPASNFSFSQPVTSVKLVADGLGGAYSPFVDPDDLTQQVIVADKSGTLTMLAQDQATGYWQSVPFYVPDPDKVIEFTGYMTRVALTRPKGQTGVQEPLVGQPVVVRYPVYTSALVNGRSITIGPTGTQVLTDNRGILSLLIPSNGVGTDMLTLEDPGDDDDAAAGNNALGRAAEIDPTTKVYQKLRTLETPEGLRSAVLPDGRKLLANVDNSDRNVEQYANAIAALNEERERIKTGAVSRSKRDRADRAVAGLDALPPSKIQLIASSPGWAESQLSRSSLSSSSSPSAALQARGNFIQDGLEWFRDLFSSIGDGIQWALQRIEDRLELWIERTDRPGLRIFLGALLDLTEAAQLIFEFIFEAVDDFLEFLIAVFDFEAMAVAQRYIVNLANGAFDVAGDAIDRAQEKVTSFFDEITQEVREFIFPPELDGHGIFNLAFGGGGSRLRKAASGLETESETMDSSVKANYLDYQIHHGGVGAALDRVNPQLGGDGMMEKLFTNVIQPLLDDFVQIIEQGAKDVALLLNDSDDISFGDALSRLAFNLVEGLLQLVEDLINGILELAQIMIETFQNVLNEPAANGLISLLTGGKSDGFSLLDLGAWIMAPFVHIAYVIQNGKGMPEDNPLPDFAGAVSPGSPDAAAAEIKTEQKKSSNKGENQDDQAAYEDPSGVSVAAGRFDLAAGIIEGIVRIIGLGETIYDGFFAAAGRSSSSKMIAVSGIGKRLPLTHPSSQLYKFLSPDPLTHQLRRRLAATNTSDENSAGLKSSLGLGITASPKTNIQWAVVFAQAVGVIVTMPYYHGFHSDSRTTRRLKLTPWFFSVFDLVGVIGLQRVKTPPLGKYEEPVWNMFWSFCSFWVTLGAGVVELKEAKAEHDEWDGTEYQDKVDKKLQMARLRLALVFVDGINAITGGFLALDPEPFSKTLLALATAATSAAGLAMVETTVGVCWDLQSKNFFVCV